LENPDVVNYITDCFEEVTVQSLLFEGDIPIFTYDLQLKENPYLKMAED